MRHVRRAWRRAEAYRVPASPHTVAVLHLLLPVVEESPSARRDGDAHGGEAQLVTITTSEKDSGPRKSVTWQRLVAELVVAVPGLALLVIAIGANQRWLDQHILPSFLLTRDWLVPLETFARVVIGVVGAWLIVHVRPRVGRFVERAPGRAWPIALAILVALAASEPVLRRIQFRPVGWLSAEDEPRRRPDSRLGWTFVPSRTGHATVAGRRIEYALDSGGYRVRHVDEPVDRERPSILFTGESVMFGEGLMWDESVPARVAMRLGIQSANLAVHGYGSDQAFMHLQAELPRFRRPVAVVTLFMSTLFGRNLDRERPHFRPGLVWQPAVRRWRLESLARLLVPYRSTPLIEEGIAMTRDVLLATVALVRAHGAVPLIVVPQFGSESEPEQRLRRRVFDGLELPVVNVQIDPAWRLKWDRHPDGRAARAMADAIASHLTANPPTSQPSN